jgi:PAS domain S-box-containing protein
MLLIDPNGVIFVSSQADWLYHVLWKPSSDRIADISATRQFGKGPWEWTGLEPANQDNAVDDSGRSYRIHRRALANYPGWDLVYLHGHDDVMEEIITPLKKSVGGVVVVLCLFFGLVIFFMFLKANTGIVQRKKVEEELRKSKEEVNSIFRAAPTGIGLVSNRMIQQVNDRVCEMTGYSRDELIGQSARIFYPSNEEYEHVGREKYRQIKRRGTGTVETRFKCKNGELIHVLMSSTPLDQADLLAGVTFTALDITERKKTEEKLKKSEERYRAYFEENIAGAYISTPGGRLIACNDEYKNIFGFESTRQALDTPVTEFSKDSGERNKFLRLLEKEKQVRGFTPNLMKVDGTPIHLIENASGVFDEKGRLKRIRGFLLDVTQQRKLETRLRQAQKMEAIGTLAGGIAHDFNNILFPVLGHTEILLHDIPEGSPTHDRLKKIYAGALRAKDLVKQILTFSRQDGFELITMKLQPIIKEALKFIRSTIPTTIDIRANISATCPSVRADATQIHQIVMNLATNAYHAMAKTGGVLTVSLKEIRIDRGDIINPDMEAGDYACLSVADTGVGMDPDLINKIFDPFFTTKEKGKGTGMGLSVVHGIVAGMNGFIRTYSEPGKGTEFNIYLPLEVCSLETHKVKDQGPIPGGSEAILLVDDEADIVGLESQILERLGYQVEAMTSSSEALEAFRKRPEAYDMVITDVAMPDMSGDRLSGELMKIRPDIPVLMCTGFSEAMTEEKVAALGIKGFLNKPIPADTFARKIRQILDESLKDETRK